VREGHRNLGLCFDDLLVVVCLQVAAIAMLTGVPVGVAQKVSVATTSVIEGSVRPKIAGSTVTPAGASSRSDGSSGHGPSSSTERIVPEHELRRHEHVG
jgi:hypothetical protein